MNPSYEDANQGEMGLSPGDQRLLDELVESGFDDRVMSGLAEAERERAERIADVFALLNDYPVEDGDDTLVHATLARISRHEDERAAAMSLESRRDEGLRTRRIRVPDFVSVAAVLLIAFGVLMPVASHLRTRAVDLGCANNLRYVGYAFGEYASDFDGALPTAIAGSAWDPQGNFLINVNLSPLVTGKYCDAGHLRCPGADSHDLVCNYSYQARIPEVRLAWGADPGATVVLGDRNPLIDAFRAGWRAPALTMSLNHGGRGQNVLGTDGSTIWLERPLIGRGDNIWLPAGHDLLEEGAAPSERGDVFLVH